FRRAAAFQLRRGGQDARHRLRTAARARLQDRDLSNRHAACGHQSDARTPGPHPRGRHSDQRPLRATGLQRVHEFYRLARDPGARTALRHGRARPVQISRWRRTAMSQVFEKASVSTESAHRMIAAAEAKAREIGVPMVIAVCDESGVLKAFSRMDGAALLSVQVAQDKAYTAVGFGMPTEGWHDFIRDDPPLAAGAVGGIDRLVIFGGGYPIKAGDRVVGAIGVSGGHYTQDMEVASAGLAVVG